MNPEIKAKWVAALRSGKYEQGTGLLRRGNRFCCLGVLCDLYDSNLWGTEDATYYFIGRSTMLPNQVEEWAELIGNAAIIVHGVRASLADHNDDGRTFTEIADAIEEQL